MNERIQKLYDQADKFAKENRTQTISGPGNNYFELFHEKFAELIVRECALVAINKDSGYMHPADVAGYMAAGRSTAAQMIKEHFGVE
jgi:hypothetical protein